MGWGVAVLCIPEYLAAFLASSSWMPAALSPTVVTTKDISRLAKSLLVGRGANSPIENSAQCHSPLCRILNPRFSTTNAQKNHLEFFEKTSENLFLGPLQTSDTSIFGSGTSAKNDHKALRVLIIVYASTYTLE